MPKTTKYTRDFLECGHCGNYAPLEIVAEFFRDLTPNRAPDDYLDYAYGASDEPPEPDMGVRYQLLMCRACDKITLHEQWESDDFERCDLTILYPITGIKAHYLPSSVRTAYQAARKARGIDANAYALLLGRMLEVVCEDREAQGKNLFHKLEILAQKGEIPERLVKVAHGIRLMRNIGAHEPLEGLSSQEISLLDDLSKAILEYIYVAQHLAREAEHRLEKLKKNSEKD